MISAPLARASVTNFCTLHRSAQRLRRSGVQVCLVKSITSTRGLLGVELGGLQRRRRRDLAVPHSRSRSAPGAAVAGAQMRPAQRQRHKLASLLSSPAGLPRCRLTAAGAGKALHSLGLQSCRRMDNSGAAGGVSVAQDVPIGQHADQPGAAQRALARDFPADRRELSDDRRAARLAQPVAADHHAAVAGLGAQRHGRPRAARPDLCAAHLGGPAADRTGAALLRRCADAGRRPQRERAPPDRVAGRRRRQVGRERADRGVGPAVRAHARRRRGADREVERAAEEHRVRAARARARAGRAGRRGRPGREPRRQPAGRPADLGAGRGRQLPQRAHPRQDAGRGARPSWSRRAPRRRPSSTS